MKYKINNFIFDDSRACLTFDGKSIKIGQKAYKLLCFLIQHKNTVVLREQLVANVWQSNHVEDNAINNLVHELRSKFNDNVAKPKFIKTVPYKGYEFIACVEVIDDKIINHKCSQSKKSNRQESPTLTYNRWDFKRKYWVIFVIISIFIAYLSSTIFLKQKPTLKQFKLIPITHERGQEWSPSLSADGKYLLYSYRENPTSASQIHIKDIENNISTALTQDDAEYFSPIWSPVAQTLYYIKSVNSQCEIWKTNVSSGLENQVYVKIASCGTGVNMSPIAVDNQNIWLYFSKISAQKKYEISRINLINGNINTLVSPDKEGIGDYSLALSPDNNWLVFLRNQNTVSNTMFLLNLNTKKVKVLLQFEHEMLKVSFSNDSQNIYYMNKYKQISSINIFSEVQTNLFQMKQQLISPYQGYNNQFYIVDTENFLNEIISFSIGSTLNESDYNVDVSTDYSGYSVSLSQDSTEIAFTSKRTEVEQVWLKTKEGFEQLTYFTKPSRITNNRISPNRKNLLFLRDQVLTILNLKNGKQEAYFEDKTILNAIWTCDGKYILLLIEENNTSTLYQLNANNMDIEFLQSDIVSLNQDCITNKIYAMQSNSSSLLELTLETNTLARIEINMKDVSHNNWDVSDNYLYLQKGNKLTKKSLITGVDTLMNLPEGKYTDFMVTKKRIIMSRKLAKDTSIQQLVEIK